jgi:hypothetical protein
VEPAHTGNTHGRGYVFRQLTLDLGTYQVHGRRLNICRNAKDGLLLRRETDNGRCRGGAICRPTTYAPK